MKLTLLILFLSALIIVPTFYFAIHFSDGVVTDGHYEKGILYDKDRHLLEKIGYKIKIKNIEKNNDKVVLTYEINLKDMSFMDKIKVSILRPGSKFDVVPDKVLRKDNLYKIYFTTKNTGHFLIRNRLNLNGKDLVYDKNFYVD